MAVGGIIEDIKEELKCTLCLDHFKEPKILHCLHTFCKQCLVPTVEENAIVCPLCRYATNVSASRGVESLASNFLYNRMINIVQVQADSSTDDSALKCGNCDGTTPPTSYCFECICFLCEECLCNHNRMKSIRERHRVIEIAGLTSSELQRLVRRSDRCKLHKESVLEFYCTRCESCVCKICSQFSAHKDHPIEPLTELTAKRKEEIETAVAEAERRLAVLKIKKCAFEDKATQLKQEARTNEEKVHRTAERFISLIRHHELAMMGELKNHQEIVETAVAAERSLLTSHLKKLDKNLKFSREVLQRASEVDIVDLEPSITAALRVGDETSVPKMAWRWMHADYSVNKDVFNLVCEPGRVLTRFTDPEKTDVHKEELAQQLLVGVKTHFTITTRNLDGQVCYSEIDRVSVEVISTVLEIAEQNVEIHNQGDGSYTVTFMPEYPGEHELHIKVNEEEVPQSPLPILVSFLATSAFGFQGTGPGELRGPTGICVSKDGEQIAVSDSGNKRIQLFDKKGNFIEAIGEYFTAGKGVRFCLPAGIAYDKFGNLVIVDQLSDKVVLINPVTKNMVKEFGGRGRGLGRFNRPWGVFIDVIGHIIVSDTDNDCVQVFDNNGDFLFMFGDSGLDGSLNGPDSALYHNGRFFVSDGESHCVKVFDEHGNFLFKFGQEGQSDGQLENPTGLCVYKENTILVCDYRNDRVQVFTMDGQHVHSFGFVGKAIGQFSWPEGVATLPDGSVLITDSENNRIQVLK